MNEFRVNRRSRSSVAVFLLVTLAWLPPGFYGVFFDHRFGDWSVYLGSHWFNEIADRQQLNYGCAPMDMLRNAYGLVFWHAIVVLCACAVAAFVVASDAGISRPISMPRAVMLSGLGAVLVYFDPLFSLVPPPFTCRSTSFSDSKFGLADQIVRHLCSEVGATILLPVLVYVLGVWICRRLGRRGKAGPAIPG